MQEDEHVVRAITHPLATFQLLLNSDGLEGLEGPSHSKSEEVLISLTCYL